MRRRLFAVIAAAVLCLGLLSGCGEEDINFIYYTSDKISTLDPQLASTPAELTAVKNLFAGLYRLDEDGTPQPDRAFETQISDDGLVYTFTLASDDQFSDGKEQTAAVTAEDYVFALQRVLDPSTGSTAAQNFLSIKNAQQVNSGSLAPEELGVRAVSDTVLEITLSVQDDGLLAKLASAAAMPCNREFFESTAGAYGLTLKNVLGNGAFYASSWTEENGLTLRRKETDGRQVNRIRLVPDDGEKTAVERFSSGEQDGALTTGEQDELTQTPALTFETTVWTLVFNCSDELLANRSIRQALAASAQLSEEDLEGHPYLRPAEGLVPGAARLTDASNWRDTVGDLVPKRAESQCYALYRQGLTDLGVERLSGLKVLIPEGTLWEELYPLINQRWQRSLAAYFSLEEVPLDELNERVASGDYDIALLPMTMTGSGPEVLLAQFTSSSTANYAVYQNASYDQLIYQGLSSTLAATQRQVWSEAERILLEDAALAPLVFQTNAFYLSEDLQGVTVDPFGPVFDFTNARRS